MRSSRDHDCVVKLQGLSQDLNNIGEIAGKFSCYKELGDCYFEISKSFSLPYLYNSTLRGLVKQLESGQSYPNCQ